MHFDPCKLIGGHEIAQAEELTAVSGEDSNLFRFVVLHQKIATQSYYKHGFMFVLVTFPILDGFLKVAVLQKEKIGLDAL